jgi:thiamine-monophosphate kinase
MREFDLIRKYFLPLTNGNKAAQKLSDDVARISLKADEELVVSTDTIVENVHFFANENASNIAAKLLLTNLSDIAAAGATPLYYTLNFAKDAKFSKEFLRDFSAGLQKTQKLYKIDLIGGDTVSSKNKFFSITIFGAVKKGKILLRANAKNGDLIFVSGSIGDAFLGLVEKSANNKKNSALTQRFLSPTPRIELGKKLLEKKLSNCAIDVSDGLLSDLRHICESSNLSAEIYLEKIPLSISAKNFLEKNPHISKLDLLSGGDDYELIFTADKKNLTKILELQKSLKLDLTCIGSITKNSNINKIKLLNAQNREIKIKKFGYEH